MEWDLGNLTDSIDWNGSSHLFLIKDAIYQCQVLRDETILAPFEFHTQQVLCRLAHIEAKGFQGGTHLVRRKRLGYITLCYIKDVVESTHLEDIGYVFIEVRQPDDAALFLAGALQLHEEAQTD